MRYLILIFCFMSISAQGQIEISDLRTESKTSAAFSSENVQLEYYSNLNRAIPPIDNRPYSDKIMDDSSPTLGIITLLVIAGAAILLYKAVRDFEKNLGRAISKGLAEAFN